MKKGNRRKMRAKQNKGMLLEAVYCQYMFGKPCAALVGLWRGSHRPQLTFLSAIDMGYKPHYGGQNNERKK